MLVSANASGGDWQWSGEAQRLPVVRNHPHHPVSQRSHGKQQPLLFALVTEAPVPEGPKP